MGVRVRRRVVRRGMAAAMLAMVALVEQPVVAGAVPPARPPSDDDFAGGEDRAATVAAQAGRLTNQVAEADAALLSLQSHVALRREETNATLIELRTARATAAAARVAADIARVHADAATAKITEAQRQIDQFAAGSYRQASTTGSITAFFGSRNPQDLLDRAELLDAVGGAQLDGLEHLQQVRTQAANQRVRARAALAAAQAAEQRATAARHGADSAYRAAVLAVAAQSDRAAALRARKAAAERQLIDVQQAVAGLSGQRQRYQQWTAARDQEPVLGPRLAQADAGESVQTVINRAMQQRGVRYSWGGGDAHGATMGIRDGGVADTHGDYRTAGFDCSGLMIYAFAPVLGYSLPHYSGSQYRAGHQVPLAQRRPGDMLFWATRGRIHHVALYIGNGQMIEAPYSGAAVRVASVRFAGIMPYATRML